MAKKDFIQKYEGAVLEATSGTPLLPSVMMAQAGIESGWGDSLLTRKYNNFFGIKADKSWKGPKVTLNTTEYIDGVRTTIPAAFRVYSDPADSFRDRIRFLIQNPRYKKVFQATTPEDQANALQAAGYATDPNYASKLISTILANGFKALDLKKK